MSNSKSLFLFGYSGHAYVVADVAQSNGYILLGYFDFNTADKNPYDLRYYGNENEQDTSKVVQDSYVFPAIGSNSIREKIIAHMENNKLKQIKLIAPSAVVSTKAEINMSTLIAPRAVVNSLANVGKGCIINTGAIVEHECKINNYSHIGPGAVLAGNVKVGKRVFIGANAVVKQGVEIGDDVVIGAGSVVLKNVPSNNIWVGNPAKKLERNAE